MDPPDFGADILGDILKGLSDEDIENLTAAAQSILGNGDSTKDEKCDSEPGGFPFDPEMLFRIAEIFEKLNSSRNDPRCNLIHALKPMLSPARREKADRAIELLRLMSILSMGDIFNMGG